MRRNLALAALLATVLGSLVTALVLVPTLGAALRVALLSTLSGVAAGGLTGLLSWWRQRRAARRVRWHRDYLVPRELPPPPTIFVGQANPVEQVLTLLRTTRGRAATGPLVIVVGGEAGVGKTAFAVKVATDALDSFPNGVVYTSLTGAGPNTTRLYNVLGDVIDSLQEPTDEVPDGLQPRVAEFARLSARRRRVLYVFDDVPDIETVMPLLPSAGEAVVLMTTRNHLDLQGVRGDIADAVVITPLADDQANELLQRLLGRPPLDEPAAVALDKIVRSAAGYPLALHLAARAIIGRGVWAITEIAEKIGDVGQPGESVGLAARRMLDLSVAVLNDKQRTFFFGLVRLPEQTFVPWMASRVAGLSTDEDDDEAWLICERLADHRLIERVSADVTGVVRLRVPDRVKAYLEAKATETQSEADLAAAQNAASAKLTEEIRQRSARVDPAESDARIHELLNQGRISLAQDTARGALADARDAAGNVDGTAKPTQVERHVLASLSEVLAELGGIDDAMEIADQSDTTTDTPRDLAAARSARSVGRLYRRQYRLGRAVAMLEQAAEIAAEISDADEEIQSLRELAVVQSMRPKEPEANLRRAYETLARAEQRLPDASTRDSLEARLLECRALIRLNEVTRHHGDQQLLESARIDLVEALRLLPSSHRLWRAWFNYHLSRVVHQQAMARVMTAAAFDDVGRRLLAESRTFGQRALNEFSAMNHKYGTARCRMELGLTYVDERPESAIPLLEDARETFMFCGDIWIEAQTAFALGRARRALKPDDKQAKVEFTFATRVFSALADKRSLAALEKATRPAVAAS